MTDEEKVFDFLKENGKSSELAISNGTKLTLPVVHDTVIAMWDAQKIGRSRYGVDYAWDLAIREAGERTHDSKVAIESPEHLDIPAKPRGRPKGVTNPAGAKHRGGWPKGVKRKSPGGPAETTPEAEPRPERDEMLEILKAIKPGMVNGRQLYKDLNLGSRPVGMGLSMLIRSGYIKQEPGNCPTCHRPNPAHLVSLTDRGHAFLEAMDKA